MYIDNANPLTDKLSEQKCFKHVNELNRASLLRQYCISSICLGKQYSTSYKGRGGRMVRWFWANFQCPGVLLILIRVGKGPTALAVGAGGGCLDIFTPLYHFSFISPSVWETARYKLKYCLKWPLSPQTTNQQPTRATLIRIYTCRFTCIFRMNYHIVKL